MTDQPTGGDKPGAPPPLAPQAPPPLAAAPPPIAPAPPAAPQPARPFLSPGVIVAMVLALILVVLAVLWFTGVLDRSPGRPAEQTTAPTALPPASGTSPPESALAPPAMGRPCDTVHAEQSAPPAGAGGAVRNRITVTASGEILWNDAAVDPVRLRQYLDYVSVMSPVPLTIVRIDPGAPPAAAQAVTEAIGRALDCDYRP